MNTKKYYYVSEEKSLKLQLPIPYQEMLSEAKNLKQRFTSHRTSEPHQGWKSLSLHGLSEDKHESWRDYGYNSALDAAKEFVWTDAAKECPATMDFLMNTFPCKIYGRVRFMLVEAGGCIDPHVDTKHRILENINIPLNNPAGCVWCWGDGETLIMEPGYAYAQNISYEHGFVNDSNEDRYHLIVSRCDSTPEWRRLIDNSAESAGVTGHYVLGDIAV